jgi:hypothetical protein
LIQEKEKNTIMRAAVIVIACLAIVAFASPAQIKRDTASASISFSGNITLTNNTQTQTLAYRSVNAFALNLGVIGLINGFFSDAAQITAVPGQTNVDLVAAGFFTEAGYYPQGYVAYFDAQEKYTVNPGGISSLAALIAALAGLNTSGGLAGIGYVQLDELNSSGAVVATVDFSNVYFNQASSTVLTDSTSNIKYGWISNTPTTNSPALYNFTVLSSSVVGKLSYGATVTPKSSDVILSISNYPYQNSTNQLRLTAVTAFGVLNFNGSSIVSAAANAIALGSGTNQFYFNGATTAEVNGNSASVSVQVTASATVSSSIQKQIQLVYASIKSAFGSNAGSAVLTATFPAGASSIIYDPVVGFEQPSTSGSAAFHASMLTVVIGAVVALFGAHL